MAKKIKYNCVATTGKFEDNEGNKKYSTINVGIVLEDESGRLSMKLNAYPLPNSNGEVWLNLYEKDKEPKEQ